MNLDNYKDDELIDLYPKLLDQLKTRGIIRTKNIIGELGGVEIVTNGDPLKPSLLKKIFESKATKLIVSMYDGEHQIDYFEKMINETGIDKERCTLEQEKKDVQDR